MIAIYLLYYILIPLTPSILLWIYLVRHGRQSIRWLAIVMTTSILLLILILWFNIREIWIIKIGIVLVIAQGLGILSMPFTSPDILNKLKLRW